MIHYLVYLKPVRQCLIRNVEQINVNTVYSLLYIFRFTLYGRYTFILENTILYEHIA